MTSQPPPVPGTGQARGAVLTGAEGHLVTITATIAAGPDAFQIEGPGLRETRDRIRAGVVNAGLPWPQGAITVTVEPTGMPGQDSALDLAITIAVLTAAGQVPAAAAGGCLLAAELGLDGRLRPVRGVLPRVLAASAAGPTTAIVAARNADEAALAPGVAVIPCPALPAVLTWLRCEPASVLAVIAPAAAAPGGHLADPGPAPASLTLAPLTRRILETCAAGGHHLRITSPPRAGAPALAAAAAALLPPLSPRGALEVAAIHSAAGLDPARQPAGKPPYQAPHHTITRAAMLGGGPGAIRPGAAPLAHRGVLYLDSAPEFDRDVLTALRQPLHDGTVTVARGGVIVRFPARFILIASMTGCPCDSQPGCTCPPIQAARYQDRLTRDLGSYFDLLLHLTAATAPRAGTAGQRQPSLLSAMRVAAARERARHRLSGTPWQVNAEIPGAELRRRYQPPATAAAAVQHAIDVGQLSNRAANQVIRVAWTLADLAGQQQPGRAECNEALAFHLGSC